MEYRNRKIEVKPKRRQKPASYRSADDIAAGVNIAAEEQAAVQNAARVTLNRMYTGFGTQGEYSCDPEKAVTGGSRKTSPCVVNNPKWGNQR